MSDFKHSQGLPWTYCQNTRCGPCGNIYMGADRYIGQAFGQAHAADLGCSPKILPALEEQMANLRLMTAAPAMLLTLSALAEAADDKPMGEVREAARRAVQRAIVGAQELQ